MICKKHPIEKGVLPKQAAFLLFYLHFLLLSFLFPSVVLSSGVDAFLRVAPKNEKMAFLHHVYAKRRENR